LVATNAFSARPPATKIWILSVRRVWQFSKRYFE